MCYTDDYGMRNSSQEFPQEFQQGLQQEFQQDLQQEFLQEFPQNLWLSWHMKEQSGKVSNRQPDQRMLERERFHDYIVA